MIIIQRIKKEEGKGKHSEQNTKSNNEAIASIKNTVTAIDPGIFLDCLQNLLRNLIKEPVWVCPFAGVLLKLMVVEYGLRIITVMLTAIKVLYFTLLCH
jgi:hypothetical protein